VNTDILRACVEMARQISVAWHEFEIPWLKSQAAQIGEHRACDQMGAAERPVAVLRSCEFTRTLELAVVENRASLAR
jgi:hypothetical protein